jgi:hypothetical protein
MTDGKVYFGSALKERDKLVDGREMCRLSLPANIVLFLRE